MSIVLKNVSRTYIAGEVKTEALKSVNLTINNGEFIVILGPSGSGKSTLLNVISGLDTITSGIIKYEDEDISKYSNEELTKFRRKNLGFVFQQYNLLKSLNVRDNIQMGADISDNSLDIDDVIQKVGLESMKNKYIYQLSGGEQQRVSIARSVVKKPKILFCDEPTGALDEKTGKKILEIIEKLNREYKTTIVIVTHNPNIASMADKIIKINSGIIEDIVINKNKKSAVNISWGVVDKYVK